MRVFLKNILVVFISFLMIFGYFSTCVQSVVNAVSENSNGEGTSILDGKIFFDVFFKENDKKEYEKKSMIKTGDSIFVSLKLKGTGVINDAKIDFSDANFKIDGNSINSNFIKSVKDNVIDLNTVIYGQEVLLEIPVLFDEGNKEDLSYYDKEFSAKISGSYKEENAVNFSGDALVKYSWTDDTRSIVNQKISKIFSWEEGTIIEDIIETDAENSVLPRESEKIEFEVPQKDNIVPDDIVVILNDNKLSSDFFTFDKENKKLVIELIRDSKEPQNTKWKSGKNEYKIIFEYNKPLNLDKTEMTFKANIKTKLFGKDIEENTSEIKQELIKLGVDVDVSVETTAQLYKGYLYTNSEIGTNYIEKINLDIASIKAMDRLEVQLGEEYYSDGQRKYSDNAKIGYKNIKMNYKNLFNILGNEGNVVIKNSDGNVYQVINKDVNPDSNGNIVLNYDNVTDLNISFSKPVKEGKITIENEKIILGNSGYDKDSLQKFSVLSNNVRVNSRESQNIESNISLLDTEYAIDFQINNKDYTTIQKNENINMLAILKKNSNSDKLYKNPTLEIVFPKEIVDVNIHNISLLYEEELKLDRYALERNQDGNLVLKIFLSGEQTKYDLSSVNKGTNIAMVADFMLDEKAESQQKPISLIVYDENDENKRVSKDVIVNYSAPTGMVSVDEIRNVNENDDEVKSILGNSAEGKLDTGKDSKVATVNNTIMNYNDNDVKDVTVLGRLPVSESENISTNSSLENDIDMKLVNEINVSGTQEADIYYSSKGNANNDLNDENNGWTKDFNNAKSYLIVLPEMQKNQKLNVEYNIQIPSDLEYNEKSSTMYKVEYTNNNDVKDYTTKPITLSTGVGPNVDVQIGVTDDEWYERQLKTVQITVKNTGETDIANLALKFLVPDGAKYAYIESESDITDNIIESDEKEIITNVATLPVGQIYTVNYQIVLQKLEGTAKEIEINAEATVEGFDDVFKATTIKKTVEPTVMEVRKNSSYTSDTEIGENTAVFYGIDVKNISDKDLNNITIKDVLEENLKYVSSYYAVSGSNTETKPNDQYDEATKTVTWNIETIKPGESARVIVHSVVTNLEEDKNIENQAVAITEDGIQVASNDVSNIAKIPKFEIQKTASIPDGEFVKEHEEFKYEIQVKNVGTAIEIVELNDIVPEDLVVKSYSYRIDDGQETVEEVGERNIFINTSLNPDQTLYLTINVYPELLPDDIDEKEITNKATLKAGIFTTFESNDISHIIEKDPLLHPDDKPEEIIDFEVSKNASVENGQTIKEGQEFEYYINIRNTGNTKQRINIEDVVPSELSVKGYSYKINDGEEFYQEYTKNDIKATIELEPENILNLTIFVKVGFLQSSIESKTISNTATVKVGDVYEFDSNSVEHIVERDPSLHPEDGKFVIEKTTSVANNVSVLEGQEFEYYIKAKNQSEEGATVNIYDLIPSELSVKGYSYKINNGEEQNVQSTDNTVSLDIELQPSDMLDMTINVQAKTLEDVDSKTIRNVAILQVNDTEAYESNEVTNVIKKDNGENPGEIVDFRIQKSSNLENNSTIRENQAIEYYIEVENIGETQKNVKIEDVIPDGIKVNGYSYRLNQEEENYEDGDATAITVNASLRPNDVVYITIFAETEKLPDGVDELVITNTATLETDGKTYSSNEITHIVSKKIPTDPDDEKDIYKITGEVWVDQDRNGKKDDYEERLSDIRVQLLDADTNEYIKDDDENIIVNVTDSEGKYRFENLKSGNYIVVFTYNTESYAVTAYQKQGVESNENSDVIEKQMEVNGISVLRGVTDTISITDKSVASIDLGLIRREQFDLSLDKNISQIVVTMGKTTQVYSGNSSKLYKVDIDSKKMNGSQVRVDYIIRISNQGDIAGYARQIYDYLPEGFSFNQSENSGWSKDGDKLVYTGLEQTVINPGETKDVHLILTRNMNRESTGNFVNVSEIGEDYNDKNVEDYNSTPANQKQGENDMSNVTLILGVKTGRAITYIGLTIVCIAILGVGIYMIRKKVL